MLNNKLKTIKEELMKPAYTEDLHDSLKTLEPEEAKIIVESMSEKEIYSKVNIRNFQQDYIADYLEFLWHISELAFWNHVKTTFDIKVGPLWSDNMFYFNKMCENKLPKDVFTKLLFFILKMNEKEEFNFNLVGCIIKAQVGKFEGQKEISEYISTLNIEKQNILSQKLSDLMESKCLFY